jgi:predicted RNA-binding protein with PUA-like domain
MSSTGYYLLKSEPSEFSIQDLEKCVVEEWDGVRNFQARNIMRTMQKGDRAFFYQSSCKNAGIVGTVVVTREAQPDVTAYQDPNHPGYDPKSTADNCRWDSVEIKFDEVFPVTVTLKELKARAKTNESIAQMTLLKNSRLSVHQLTAAEWSAVEELVDEKVPGENIGES